MPSTAEFEILLFVFKVKTLLAVWLDHLYSWSRGISVAMSSIVGELCKMLWGLYRSYHRPMYQ
eukprot:6189327-Pleurochrysis_carterae.AAC.2